jgi:hypothetical protein
MYSLCLPRSPFGGILIFGLVVAFLTFDSLSVLSAKTLVRAPSISIDAVDKVLAARPPHYPIASTPIAPAAEITTLAASLKNNPDLIFEYVYNNIEYEPLFGSNKGPLGTLLDGRGNDIDQAQLLVALLNAAGFSATYEYGYKNLPGDYASSWLGVKNDGYAIVNLLANGGIPIGNPARPRLCCEKFCERSDCPGNTKPRQMGISDT